MTFLLRMLRIRRVEFLVAEIPILVLPALLTLRSPAELRPATAWEGTLVFFLLFNFGDMINCLADRELDARYKKHLAEAVMGLGTRFVATQIALTGAAAMLITWHLSTALGRPLLVPLVAVGLLLGAAYSVEPVRLKGRGLSGLICQWLIIFVGPMLFVTQLCTELLPPVLLALACAYATVQMGIILVNTAEDYPEDIEAGVRTIMVAWGVRRGIGLARAMVALGGAGVLATLGAFFAARGVPAPWLVALSPLMLAWLSAVRSLGRLRARFEGAAPEAAVAELKLAGRSVPLWLTAIAWSTLLAALVPFLRGTM